MRFKENLTAYVDQGGHVLGICGGYQMLGSRVEDPQGLEGVSGVSEGLGLLPVKTRLKSPKTTTISDFLWEGDRGSGYEIHMGETHGMKYGGTPLIQITSRNQKSCKDTDGCLRDDGRVAGTYIHGFFDHPGICKKWLTMVGIDIKGLDLGKGFADQKEEDYTLLKKHFEKYVDISSLTI